MKRTPPVFATRIAWLCGLSAVAATVAPPPETLTLADLANRPDRWPATVTVQRDFKFVNGPTIHQGDPARVLRFDGAQAILITPTNIRFKVLPADCGLLDAANQAWGALTPAQRAIDPASLPANPSLWPLRVTTTSPISCPFGKLPAGTDVELRTVTGRGITIGWPNSPNRVTVDLANTDVIARARQLALVDPDKRPSRIADALAALLVDADGHPVHDEHLADKKLFALYFGAGWCAPCHAFSPDLVKFLDGALPAHPELAAVLLSNDKDDGQMLAYMKEEQMPFPAVPPKPLLQSGLLMTYAAPIIPHLVVVDRFGRVLASNDDGHGNRTDPKDTIDALARLLAAPAAEH